VISFLNFFPWAKFILALAPNPLREQEHVASIIFENESTESIVTVLKKFSVVFETGFGSSYCSNAEATKLDPSLSSEL
jgi:hypothetical protein